MRGIRTATVIAALGALGACAQMEAIGIGPGQGTTDVARAGDPCGAEPLQGLVGTSVGELDAGILPENRRVIFPGMAVTEDFSPERLNVEVGTDDRIARVYCG